MNCYSLGVNREAPFIQNLPQEKEISTFLSTNNFYSPSLYPLLEHYLFYGLEEEEDFYKSKKTYDFNKTIEEDSTKNPQIVKIRIEESKLINVTMNSFLSPSLPNASEEQLIREEAILATLFEDFPLASFGDSDLISFKEESFYY